MDLILRRLRLFLGRGRLRFLFGFGKNSVSGLEELVVGIAVTVVATVVVAAVVVDAS